jgi:2-polyprenyl-6-methoxyphenol hydroxylase-like FAD-dependent oxidoreductase
MTAHDSRTALIAGAGIAGLAAGVALGRAGWSVRIHERATSPRELGFGLLLAPNALSALRELGVADAVVNRGVAGSGIEIRRLSGRLIRRFDIPASLPAIVALRSELHGALLTAIGDDALRLGSEVESFSDETEGVTVYFRDGSTDTARVLIGADGVASVIRRQLHPEEPSPRPSGFCAVRGVAYGVGPHLRDLTAVSYLDDGIEAATARAGHDAIYWYLSMLSRDNPADSRTPAAILTRLMAKCEPSLTAIVSATTPDDMRFDELFARDPLPWWGRGRVTLLGDAAHPLLPHTGQGAALALEDAVSLGHALSAGVDVARALRRYEESRMRRTRRLIWLGPRIARVTTTRSAWIQLARSAAIQVVPAWMIKGIRT